MFPFPFSPPMGMSLITVDAAYFDGTNDYATRGAALTGVSDSKLMTCVFWANIPATGDSDKIFVGVDSIGGGTERINFRLNGAQLIIEGRNASSAVTLSVASTSALDSGTWKCVMSSFDMADTGKRHLYFGDTNELNVTTYTNENLVLSAADWGVGGEPNGTNLLAGGLAELMFWPGAYIDFSQEANRRKFISSSGKPVNPSAVNGAIATLGAPAVYLHLDNGETANNFALNNDGGATGGAFTVTGALTTYASSPSD